MVQPVVPCLVEFDACRDLVSGLKSWGQFGFQRALVEQLGSEGVERADGGVVEVLDALSAAPAFLFAEGFVLCRPFELLTDAVAQLRGRGLGECNGGEPVEGGAARCHQVNHAVDEAGGLAGAGTGFDEECLVQIVANYRPGGLVGEPELCGRKGCHWLASSLAGERER